MMKDYSITSFGNDFDTIPAVWIDLIQLIDSNIISAMEVKNKK